MQKPNGRVSVAADACGTSKKICNAKAYLLGAEPEFLECEILGATEIFSTRVAFFWENGMDQEQQQRVHAPVTIY
jgi:hypothetical protein